jgi:molybdenum cofactor cytidylyltransferase
MTVNSDIEVGGLLLAAGGSTRFGSPKQLAEFEAETLIRRAAESVCGSGCAIVVAVLGAAADESRHQLSDLDLVTVENKDWQSGMSSTIRIGLSKLIEIEPQLDAVLITLVDQPKVTASHLGRFVAAFIEGGALIIAAEYSGTTGVPALFARPLFDELLQLEGDQGARSIIRKRSNNTTIPLDEAATDIDSLADLEDLEHTSRQ